MSIEKSIKDGVTRIIRGLRYNGIASEKVRSTKERISNKEYIFRILVFMKLVEENVAKAQLDKKTELLVEGYIKKKKGK